METKNNYTIQMQSAQAQFLKYDQQAIIRKFNLKNDEDYLHPTFLGRQYRLCRRTGNLESFHHDAWQDANTFGEVMTLLDILCDAKDLRYITGRWKAMANFGLMFHSKMIEEKKDPLAEAFDKAPEAFHRACLAMGGIPISGGDISYSVELMDGLCIAVQFWHGDEDFAPQFRFFWDDNALQYLRYETMHYALGFFQDRLREESLLFPENVV